MSREMCPTLFVKGDKIVCVHKVVGEKGWPMTEVCDFCDQISADITKTNTNSDICSECRDSGDWDRYLRKDER